MTDDTLCQNAVEKTGIYAWKVPSGNDIFKYVELKGDVRFNDVVFGYIPGKNDI